MTKTEDKEKEKSGRETLGKYFYDMSKLIFAAIVLTNLTELFGITEFSWKSVALFCVGLTATYATAPNFVTPVRKVKRRSSSAPLKVV